MASPSTGSSHLGVTDDQKRWLVAGIALNKILIPQIRPYVEQQIENGYNKLKASHNIHGQSTSGRLKRWPARTVLKYENINGNDAHPRLSGGRLNYSLFDCRVTSHVDFARLYVENYMAKFVAFDEHCDASAVLSLLGRVPVFPARIQAAAGDVRMARNDWTNCVFSKWDQATFQQSFLEMEQLVKVLNLPTADEGKRLGELRDWQTKGTHLCMNSPVNPVLLQLVQQHLNSLQDEVKNMSADCEEEKTKVQAALQNCASGIEDLKQRVERLETGKLTIKSQAELTEKRVRDLEDRVSVVEEKLEGVQTLLLEPNLPQKGTHFIGRKKECEEIISHVTSQSTRIVGIYGPPGFGKSQVAIAVGNDLQFQGKSVYHLELQGVKTQDDLLSKFVYYIKSTSQLLKPKFDFLCKTFEIVRDHLYFILDDIDNLLEPNVRDEVINLIKEILTRCPKVKFIVTSRKSPAFRKLESLGQTVIRVGYLDDFYCHTLVQKLISEASDDDCKKIAKLCENMPFAIDLMCRSILESEMPLNEAISDFERPTNNLFKMLDEPEEVSDSTLKGIFGSSFERLSKDEKNGFVSLLVISEYFDEKVPAAVLGMTTSDAKTLLKRLHRKSLIEFRSGLYKMPQLLQSFGKEKVENEMKVVFNNARTRFYEYYISIFRKLNKEFLLGSSKSMSAFMAFFQDKHSIVSSLIEGSSENGETSNRAFDALIEGNLFLDTLLWSDNATFAKIYDSAIKKAERGGNKAVCNKLVVAKAFSEVTWGTAEGITMQSLSFRKEIEACTSDGEKGKRSCYFGIYHLVSGKLNEGVELLRNAMSYLDGTNDQYLKILKVLTCQILALYYESENSVKRAKKFSTIAYEECEAIEDPSLLVVPDQRKTVLKENKCLRCTPLAVEMYSLITRAAKIFSPDETMKAFEHEFLQMEKEISLNPSTKSGVGLFYLHRTIVGVLGEMSRYEDAIKSIQATIDVQEADLQQYTKCDYNSQDTKSNDEATGGLQMRVHNEVLAKNYFYLAVLHSRKKDYKASLQSHWHALEIRRELVGEEHESIADSYHELGIIFRILEDYNSALHFQQRALDIRKKLSDEYPLKTADSYHELGVTLCGVGDYSTALGNHEIALEIRKERLGKQHIDTAFSYHEVGVIQWYLRKYESALEKHKAALGIALEILGKHHIVTADSYYELGKTYFRLEDYSAALFSHQDALDIRLDVLGEQHVDTADSYYEIGLTNFEMEQYYWALQNHERALAARLKTRQGQQSMEIDIAQSYRQLGRVHCQMGNTCEAFQSHNHALSVIERFEGFQKPETAYCFYELGKTFFSKKDYASAFVMHKLALAIRKRTLGMEDCNTADSLYHRGLVQGKLGCYQSSVESHKSSLQIRQQIFGKNNTKTAESYYELGLLQFRLGNTSEAIDSHRQALEIRLERFHLGYCHTATADSYLALGNVQLKKGDFPSSFESFQTAVQIRTDLLANHPSEVGNFSFHEQVEETLSHDYTSALQTYRRVSTVTRENSSILGSHGHLLRKELEKLKEQLAKKANTYYDLGNREFQIKSNQIPFNGNNLTKALDLHKRALQIRLELFGEKHPETANSFHELGVTQCKMKDFSSALQSLQRALDIRLKLFAKNHPQTANSFHAIGVTQCKMKDFTSALQSLQRVLDIRLKLFRENHPLTVNSFHELGVTQCKMKDFSSARQSLQRALYIRLKLFGENHPQTADTFHELGVTQCKMKDFTSALQSLQRALDIRLKLFGENHPQTANSFHELGVTQCKMKDFTSALQSLQRALDIRLKLFGENHPQTANSFHELGVTQCKMKDFTSALQLPHRALDITLKLFGENHPLTANSFHELGVTQCKMKDFSSARQSLQRALDIRLKLFGENHPQTADSFHELGVTQCKLKDFSSARQSLQRALNIRLKLFDESHQQIADSYHSLGITQRKMEYFTSAPQSHQSALDIRRKPFGENHEKTDGSSHSLGFTQHEMTKKFEAEHRECLRVLPYSDGGQVYVQLYVYSGKRGIPKELKDAAQECFGKMGVKLKWSDLYNDASNVLNVTSVDYPSGKPKRLEVSQVDEINKNVNESLHIFSRHRNITAVQASFKVTKSKQTGDPCIMVYVLGKGRIPIGESEIPHTIGKYPVDIVDGFWIKTLDPWQPTEAQEQSDYIRLGASIGVKGEKGSGTLGAVVKDESSGALYLLSCDHVIKSTEQSEIIHPGWDAHLNFFKYHLNEYRKWIDQISETNCQETTFLLDSLQDREDLFKEKFKELKTIKEKHSNIPGDKLKKIKKHEKALESISSKPPRSVANYTTGVFDNVEWSDGKEYFIDAAIAVLKEDEVNALKLSGTTEIIGTGDYPSGECIPATTKAIMNAGELLKSGSFTGYTSSNRLVGASIVAPPFLQGPAYELNGALVSVKMYYCENCAKSLLTQCEIEVQGLDHFTCVRCTNKVSQCKSSWRKNCLCIESERYPFVNRGDSGAVIFEKHDPSQACLPGFGIVFGMLETAYKSYALASPLEIALKTLSQNVSTTCNLKLVTKY